MRNLPVWVVFHEPMIFFTPRTGWLLRDPAFSVFVTFSGAFVGIADQARRPPKRPRGFIPVPVLALP